METLDKKASPLPHEEMRQLFCALLNHLSTICF